VSISKGSAAAKIIASTSLSALFSLDGNVTILGFKDGLRYKNTGKAGIFAGSLELVKEGNLTMKQEKLFDDIYIKEVK
jgi:chromatin segregation and condensation protein Rec8/ScpA/Scc1 (kleisin family)